MVQRALAAKNVVHAKGGAIFAGFLKIIPLFIMVFPGMISRVLYKDDVACPDAESCERACGNKLSCSNLAYPRYGCVLGKCVAKCFIDITHPPTPFQPPQ